MFADLMIEMTYMTPRQLRQIVEEIERGKYGKR